MLSHWVHWHLKEWLFLCLRKGSKVVKYIQSTSKKSGSDFLLFTFIIQYCVNCERKANILGISILNQDYLLKNRILKIGFGVSIFQYNYIHLAAWRIFWMTKFQILLKTVDVNHKKMMFVRRWPNFTSYCDYYFKK